MTHIAEGDYFVCVGCRENGNYASCNECGVYNHYDDLDDGLCPRCAVVDERKPTNSPALVTPEKGDMITSMRPFGVEIECQYPDRSSVDKMMRNFSSMGFSGDGSVAGKGVEFQSPILAGKVGEEYIAKFCKGLNALGFKVDNTCGLHIHLSCEDIVGHGYRLGTVWAFYHAFDDVILSFLPESRRNNSYCLPLSEMYSMNAVMEAAHSNSELEYLWYKIPRVRGGSSRIEDAKREKKHRTRYCGINLHTLISEKHIEIRYHSGTINAKKILNWTYLHQAILDMIGSDNAPSLEVIKRGRRCLSIVEKTHFMFSMLKLPKEIETYFFDRQKQFNQFKEVFDTKIEMLDNENALCAE